MYVRRSSRTINRRSTVSRSRRVVRRVPRSNIRVRSRFQRRSVRSRPVIRRRTRR